MALAITLVAFGASLLPSMGFSDEVDDILAKKSHNRDRVKHFAAEYTVETDQPTTVKHPKKTRLHFKMSLTKLPAAARQHSNNPWLLERARSLSRSR